MQYTEFLDLVQQHAGLNSPARAATVTRATLRTLAERIQGDSANNLASQLPLGLAVLLRRPAGLTGGQFPVDEFVRRVAERADLESAEAIRELRIVLQELSIAVSQGQIDRIWAELPGEYLNLLEPTSNSGRAGSIRANRTGEAQA